MLDLDDLATFVEVADAGGVSAAARRLGVSKSIVSRRQSGKWMLKCCLSHHCS
jgi:DNA-binding transcriptional LysR family regulator